MSKLKRVLYDEYGGFADKRIKKLEKGKRFFVDSRVTNFGLASDGSPYSWFCLIELEVLDEHSVSVQLGPFFPTGKQIDDQITAWLTRNNLSIREPRYLHSLVLIIDTSKLHLLEELAALIRECHSHATTSLRRLRDLLSEVWAKPVQCADDDSNEEPA